ncbi:MAG TPA: SAM-dependent methyltransferase [Bacteroidetes bacterium]|nr:SAM-dependent methyltransferase [Bacteroidota bacterium]
MKDRNILYTEDGSHTVYAAKFDSLYHSSHGAMRESNHVFIENGLRYFFKTNKNGAIKILEYGFGTGLNALLSMDFAKKNDIIIEYTGIEAYPLDLEEIKELNYLEESGLSYLKREFLAMHEKDMIQDLELNKNFKFTKLKKMFEDFEEKDCYDIVYYDVFGAEVQAELWLRPQLDKVIGNLKKKGILITYGAKGSFKRALKSLNMEVQSLPGPPGKREITRAIKM